MKKSYYCQHQELLRDFKIRIQLVFPKARFFDRHVGLFYTKQGEPIKINKPGMSDIWALFPGGVYLEYEIKSGQARKSKDQKNWTKFLETMGTTSIEVRNDNFEDVVFKTKKRLGF